LRFEIIEVGEAFYRQPKVASQSQALEDFNHPAICWKDHTARHMQNTDDNFLMQAVEKSHAAGPCTNEQRGTG